jgi:hypothetical protein
MYQTMTTVQTPAPSKFRLPAHLKLILLFLISCLAQCPYQRPVKREFLKIILKKDNIQYSIRRDQLHQNHMEKFS